jgi:hypothetical protein
MLRTRRQVPSWLLATAALLTTALAISITAGRVAEVIIIAVLLVPTLAFLVLWIGSRTGRFGRGGVN